MKKISKFVENLFQKQVTFSILAVTLVALLLAFVIYASTFLIGEINKSLSVETESISLPQFDIAGFEKLNLPR